MTKKKTDIICVGELLIDMIGDEVAENLEQTKSFSKYVGGSSTNVAKNMTQLGFNTALVATLGQDGLGDFATKNLETIHVNTAFLNYKKDQSTSMILVSRTTGTPDFLPFRQADFCIEPYQIPTDLLNDAKIFHTTCFALSKNPAQTTILQKAKEAYEKGCQLSIDLNYAEKIWGDEVVIPVLKTFFQYQPIVKLSDDDAFRIFKKQVSDVELFDYFLNLGAKLVCLTKGKNGAYVKTTNEGLIFQEAPKINKVVDATGAGDAFWSGFLAGYLKGIPIKACLQAANNLVVKKMQHIGGLPPDIDINQIIN